MKFYLVILSLVLLGCKETETKNKQLLAFQSIYLGEKTSTEKNLITSLEEDVKVTYVDNLIIASKTLEVNECGKYDGDLEFMQDTIVLIQKSLAAELCDSQVIKRFSYIISNPDNKKFKIYFKN